jgi:hypothetical protein
VREGDSEELDTPEPGDTSEGIDEGDLNLDGAVKPTAVIVLDGNSEFFEKRVSMS